MPSPKASANIVNMPGFKLSMTFWIMPENPEESSNPPVPNPPEPNPPEPMPALCIEDANELKGTSSSRSVTRVNAIAAATASSAAKIAARFRSPQP